MLQRCECSLVISTLQLLLMMVIITRLNCNIGLILRLLDNPSCWHTACPPRPLLGCPNKGHVEAQEQLSVGSSEPAGSPFLTKVNSRTHKERIRSLAHTTKEKIESLDGNMWLIPFCQQWILKFLAAMSNYL